MEKTLSGKASEFVKMVDGQQMIDFKMLENQYGAEFAEFIKGQINNCAEKQYEWKLEINDQSKRTTEFVFATHAFAYILEVSHLRKVITENNFVGYYGCERALKLMSKCSDTYFSRKDL